MKKKLPRTCVICGCTDEDCSQCIAATGEPCHWIDPDLDLCSRCDNEMMDEALQDSLNDTTEPDIPFDIEPEPTNHNSNE